ncbi:hypothetical protein ACOMHN_016239 [Nucella lapillus]
MATAQACHNEGERQLELFEDCQYGTWEDVLGVVAKGASLAISDENDLNALHYACLGNNYNVAHKMFKERHDIFMSHLFQKSQRGRETPLLMACRLGHELLTVLLSITSEERFIMRNDNKETTLHVACRHGHDTLVRYLLGPSNDHINTRDRLGDTPLHTAVRAGHYEVVGALLKYRADAHVTNLMLNNALHESVIWARWEIMELIAVTQNVDINKPGEHERTALHLACCRVNPKAVEKLLSLGADPNILTSTLSSPLHAASAAGQIDVVRSLLLAGACVNLVDTHGYTSLCLSSRSGHTAVVQLLLRHGAIVDMQSARSAVHLAFSGEHWDTAKVLIQGNKQSSAQRVKVPDSPL